MVSAETGELARILHWGFGEYVLLHGPAVPVWDPVSVGDEHVFAVTWKGVQCAVTVADLHACAEREEQAQRATDLLFEAYRARDAAFMRVTGEMRNLHRPHPFDPSRPRPTDGKCRECGKPCPCPTVNAMWSAMDREENGNEEAKR